jgi:hypothetical protein
MGWGSRGSQPQSLFKSRDSQLYDSRLLGQRKPSSNSPSKGSKVELNGKTPSRAGTANTMLYASRFECINLRLGSAVIDQERHSQ